MIGTSLDCHKETSRSLMVAWGAGHTNVCTGFHVPMWHPEVNENVIVNPVVEYADSIIMELTNNRNLLQNECKRWRELAEGAGLSLPEENEEGGDKEEEEECKEEGPKKEEDGKGSGNAIDLDGGNEDEEDEGGGTTSAPGGKDGKGRSGGKPGGWLVRRLLTKLVVPKTERLVSHGILSCAIVHCGMP